MTKRELIEALAPFEDNAVVLIDVPNTEWQIVSKVRRDVNGKSVVFKTVDYEG